VLDIVVRVHVHDSRVVKQPWVAPGLES
jgi:hypothetical protein